MRGRPRRPGCAGQQMGEFAILVSAVALAAVGVSFLAQRAIGRGVQTAGDLVLDRPVPYTSVLRDARNAARFRGRTIGSCLDEQGGLNGRGDGVCDCDDRNRDGECDEIDMTSASRVEQAGDGNGLRRTTSSSAVKGKSEGQEVTLRPIIPRREKP